MTKGVDVEALTEETLAAFDILKAVLNRLLRTELKCFRRALALSHEEPVGGLQVRLECSHNVLVGVPKKPIRELAVKLRLDRLSDLDLLNHESCLARKVRVQICGPAVRAEDALDTARRAAAESGNGDGANEAEIATIVEVGDDLTSQARHSLLLSGSPPSGKLLNPLERRDVRVG